MEVQASGELRLAFADDLFLRRHRGLGAPVVNQFVWRFAARLPEGALDAYAAELARGGLARRAVPAVVPGARRRWVPHEERHAVDHHPEPLAADAAVRTWIEARAALPHDPAAGPAWRLATAPLADGGRLVSLTVSHAVADGGALLDAMARASRAGTPRRLPPPGDLPLLVRDLRDAGGQVGAVGRWVLDGAVARVRGGRRAAAAPAAPASSASSTTARPARVDLPDDWAPPWCTVELPSAEVAHAARAHGGSQNAWFVAVAAGLVHRTGRVGPHEPVPVALPVSTRTPDDPRANATRIARVQVDPALLEHRDLGGVRAACRSAYEAVPASREPVPLALVQMAPDRLLRFLPPPPAAAVLASNLGAPPAEVASIGGVPAVAMTALAHQPGLSAADAAATGGGLLAWATDVGTTTTVAVVALDPLRVPDVSALRGHLEAELRQWVPAAEGRWVA
ncbi:hypothetical protein QE405_003734 [Nocardioides zeae]|uniref:Uncharacterized protein n=1 Tax=Nocardioides zeae TaxID=1457234 RepID=A0AAJ1U1X0_9ACTN|nr:hypothetical protein [Nocardioides zeae]